MLQRSFLRRARLGLECLEGRQLLCATTISGFVYDDANANGVRDPGEAPIAGSTLELRNASGVVVAHATTDANGRYEFTTDRTISTAPQTRTVVATFAPAKTGWTRIATAPQFDPSLGELTSVTITSTASIETQIQMENVDEEAGTIDASVTGTVTVTPPAGAPLTSRLTVTDSFDAPAFDGTADLDGPSFSDSGPLTRSGSQSLTLTSPADLARFTGTGNVTFNGRATARSTLGGPGNVVAAISTLAGADVQIVYHYTPSNCLRPGNYTIVQTQQPAGYLDGRESQGGVGLPNSINADVIPVVLGDGPSINNNFGEVRPAQVSGFVYLDLNNNGLRDAGETTGFGGLVMQLTGTNDAGLISALTVTTNADGSYAFAGLRPGTYTVTELTQPAGFISGQKTRGNVTPLPGGAAIPDIIPDIVAPAGSSRPENNFGKLAAGPVTPQVPPTTPPPSKLNLLSSALRRLRRT